MPKRRAVAIHSESDEDIVSEGSPAVKRARTEAESDSEDVGTKPTNRASRSKGKSRRRRDEDVQVDDEDVEVGQFEPDEDEEKRFEEEHEDEIRERLMHKGKSQGGIAEMGIIESLEMHQFMCHKYLTFTMGPQINFIIGHNGSGKSAVLSALTVALGGKATSTGRGTGLKSFIREGQNVAEVTVVLKNQGEEAYRPKDYGKSIVITRRFNKDGGSSYKIKSKDGKVISTKREELSAICDHMNIQVDNPMNILTQDSARQFLSASQPGDKYRFFLRGTQLSQLSEEYQTCMENISQTQKVLKRKSEVIPDLQEALSEATARFQEASKAREQRHKADELKKELAWAHVAVKEEEMTAKFEEVAKLKRRLSKIQESSRQAESEVEECRASIAKLEQERADLGDRGDLVTKRDALQDQIRANAQKLMEFNREEKEMEDSKRKLDSIIAGLKSQIEAEEKRIQEFSQGKRDETNRKLEEANAELKQAEEHLNSIRAEINQKRVDCDSASQEGRTLESEAHQMKDRIVNCEQQLEMSRAQEKNKLAQFGRNMESVLAEIQKGRWYGRQPAGPFGTYVKVKDPKQWAPLLRIQIGGMMSGFAITDARDRKALDKILRDHGNGNCPIIISEVDMFDYSQGEPPESYLTILRALEISDPYVLRVLVNALHIESTLLAPTRAEADSTLRSMGRGGVACAADLYRVVRFPEGGGQSSIIQPLQGSDIRHQLFTGGNVEAEIKRWTVERDALNTQLSTLNGRIQELKGDYAQWRHAIESLQRQESSLQQEVRRLKTVRDNLMLEVNDEMPAGVQGLQAALLEQEADKELLLAQFVQLTRNKLQVNEEQHPLMDKKDKVKAQLSEFSEKETALHAQLEAMGVKFKKLQNDIEFYAKKVKPEEDMIAAAEDAANNLQEEYAIWTTKAETFSERIPNPRKVDEIQRNLDAVQAALREREKRHGATVEEMTIEVNKKSAALDTAKKDLKNMVNLNKALRKSVRVRLAKWHEFRRHIALRCKVYFSYHLSNRGYYGKVLFDHVAGTLQLKVQTDDQTATQNSREKDPRSLSGGEKSFSTICLLLSLWESIGCPIRCLDEFDVFMDAVNRRISMKMMIDTANTSNRKQYILITPQDMTNISIGNTVRVHRMTDPERGQGVLAFQ